jgi:hypothetical protein
VQPYFGCSPKRASGAVQRVSGAHWDSGLGFRVLRWNLGLGHGLGYSLVYSLGFRVLRWNLDPGFRVSGFRFQVSGFG